MRRSTHSHALHGVALFVAVVSATPPSTADTFGSGDLAFEIPFVTIGDPGNPADTTGAPNPAGSVGYTYRIGKYEVPEQAIRKANELSEAAGDPLAITIDDRVPNKPATRLSWFEAARFVNWLNAEKGAAPAYKFDGAGEFQLWSPGDVGYDPQNPFRNSLSQYFIPSVDEWYKAAYYDPTLDAYWDYPTGSDEPPTPVASGTELGTAVWNQPTGLADITQSGGPSPFGTIAQGGNVEEWQETTLFGDPTSLLSPDTRGVRGGQAGLVTNAFPLSVLGGDDSLAGRSSQIGFRVAAVPEPASALSLNLALVGFLASSADRRRMSRL
ncbi:SUMF1/EgtB/PvdO family nonheme iron enzyme [Botrimarina sp.]|uniref:SUMF1/EgtB/PvdO family nonheme iron enzyme n=1 Tax=Botrimarina sp. TaxID=2795802 RepID=UPI0032EFECF4